MTTQYNIGRVLTQDELDSVASYHNWAFIEQDSDGNVSHNGIPVTEDQINEAMTCNAL